jgi:hypothetical protein
MIAGTPYSVERSENQITVSFSTNDSSDIIVFDCGDEEEAYDCYAMWDALITAASEDPANNKSVSEDDQ